MFYDANESTLIGIGQRYSNLLISLRAFNISFHLLPPIKQPFQFQLKVDITKMNDYIEFLCIKAFTFSVFSSFNLKSWIGKVANLCKRKRKKMNVASAEMCIIKER